MIRTRLTSLIVGAVAALLLVAGLDAIRSSDGGTQASDTATSAIARSTFSSANLGGWPPTSEMATGFQSVWNVPYAFRGSKPERLQGGGGEKQSTR
jgi:hypothetical protein